MDKRNFLLGKGERLTSDILPAPKKPVKEDTYTFYEARERLSPKIKQASKFIDELPEDACPLDEAVFSITLNPEYIAKSYYPFQLLQQIGAEVVGSKPRNITPQKRSRDRVPIEAVSTELFAKAPRDALRRWSTDLPNWSGESKAQSTLITIEEIEAPKPDSKIKGPVPQTGAVPLEIVLHADELEAHTYLLGAFSEFFEHRGFQTKFGKRFFARGLCFLEAEVDASWVPEIASFSMVRALREMPSLRILRPTIRSSIIPSAAPALPDHDAIDENIRVAVFDGGIPADHPLTQWVTPYELPGMRPANPEYLEHGTSVSSALLFGHIDHRHELPRPFANIDHFRVLDDDPAQDEHELYEVLDRIDSILASSEYDFVNLSLGPRLAVEDDDVHAWTAVLDDRFARSKTLAAIAVGNDGKADETLGYNRIQVPADCVNAIAVGACDTPDTDWQRAPYSSVGPGRSPGIIKPDLVDFGGSLNRPFITLSNDSSSPLVPTAGTSFAAPNLLRLATGVRAQFGNGINDLTLRALLVHTADQSDIDLCEVGRGRVARSIEAITTCDDDTIRVVYQGEISPAKYIRAQIPFPAEGLEGMVSIAATICYKCITDPHHPGNYTRAGLEIAFRPNDQKFKNGDKQMHADTRSFFSAPGSGTSEAELRRDAWKWENCLHSEIKMRATGLQNPCFDIHYNSRMEGRNGSPDQKLPYAMVITLRAKKVADLYNQIVRDYATVIEPIRPVLEIPISNR